MSNMDTGDLYEGGKSSKRKRDFDDDDSDNDGRGRSNDPDGYNSNMAKMRTNLIRSELNKRRSGATTESPKVKISEEEKQRAKCTKLIDPFNAKIANLTLKSRENWFTKMCQVMQENFDLFSNNPENTEEKKYELCVKFEYEILEKAKNLSIYQAKCMTKYKEIRNLSAAKKSFLDEYLKQQVKLDLEDNAHDLSVNENSFKKLEISGFKSAASLIPGELVKKPVVKTESKPTEYSMPKFVEKSSSVFTEIEKMGNLNTKLKTESYDQMLETMPVKSDSERMREARLLKFNNANKIEVDTGDKKIVEEVKEEKVYNEDIKAVSTPDTKVLPKADIKVEKLTNDTLGLATISSLVVLELTPYYKAKRFASKVIFKPGKIVF